MVSYKILFVFILISTNRSVISELTTEKLVGGAPAYVEDYKYQVGIIGRHNNSYARYIACGGGIISNFFILSNAECFFDRTNKLMKLRFYAILGSVNLRYDFQDVQEVIYIYTYTRYPLANKYFIVILQLMDSLHLDINHHVRKLNLPTKDQKYTIQARVAGYGFKTLEERKRNIGKSRPKVSVNRDFNLTYAYVDIDESPRCYDPYRNMNTSKELCGRIRPYIHVPRRGLCTYDEGAPLVIGSDLIIGVAIRNRLNCDNTVHGQMYSNVAYYLDFINGVKNGSHVANTTIYVNRPYMFYV